MGVAGAAALLLTLDAVAEPYSERLFEGRGELHGAALAGSFHLENAIAKASMRFGGGNGSSRDDEYN